MAVDNFDPGSDIKLAQKEREKRGKSYIPQRCERYINFLGNLFRWRQSI
jgi:hypothetical protein